MGNRTGYQVVWYAEIYKTRVKSEQFGEAITRVEQMIGFFA